jgi:hypothetical protein
MSECGQMLVVTADEFFEMGRFLVLGAPSGSPVANSGSPV